VLRLTQGLSQLEETSNDSSKSSSETTTTNPASLPIPPINIRLETVIKIAEVILKQKTNF